MDIEPLRTNLTFDRKDSTVTLLKNDQVLINLLTDIVTEKRRATNIRPKIPATFSATQEIREMVRRARRPPCTNQHPLQMSLFMVTSFPMTTTNTGNLLACWLMSVTGGVASPNTNI